MTSEVVLMNRGAVALAADSATTSQYWTGSTWETRYFKGANKIFNLARNNPVGLMTYDSANTQGAPWEVVVKAYRKDKGQLPRDTLHDYAPSLFSYMEENLHLFPADYQAKQFLSSARNGAMLMLMWTLNSDGFPRDGKKAERQNAAAEVLANYRRDMETGALIGGATPETIQKIIEQHKKEVERAVSDQDFYKENKDISKPGDLAELGIWSVFNKGMPGLDKTGVVIAGYGENDYFPSAMHYTCYGPILGKVYYDSGARRCVNQENISEIVPLARSDMMKTFAYGLGAETGTKIDEEFSNALNTFEAFLREQCGLDADTAAFKSMVREQFSSAILSYMYTSHVSKLRTVVGMLPISELAELAETLVLIESLKERVTGPSESVSGPVDVAVISKGDGFIWIKRKHYFDAKLNPRYFRAFERRVGE